MTEPLNKAVADYIAALGGTLRPHLAEEPGLTPFVSALAELDPTAAQPAEKTAEPRAVGAHLAACLGSMDCPPVLGGAVGALAPLLRWYQIFDTASGGDDLPAGLAEGMVAGQLAGRTGLIRTDRMVCGLFLLAPDLYYPTHQHSALEIYYVCAGGLTLQHGRRGDPFRLAPGEWSITPSHRLHALRTADLPCLIAFAWVGDLSGANWWWEETADGSWQRTSWERGSDGAWRRTKRESVGPATLAEAGET